MKRSKIVSVLLLSSVLAASSITAASAAAGALDPTFGGDGKVVTNVTKGSDAISDIAIQTNGKIVAVGRAVTRHYYGKFALARYRTNGTLDPAFGGDGIVATNFAKREDSASAVAIQSDGKIVAAGSADVTALDGWFALARYDTDGTRDASFGVDGKVTTNFTTSDDRASDVAIQTDDKIVVVGSTGPGRFAIARYDTSGSLDPTFGGDGVVTTNVTSGYDSATSVAIDTDGNIVVAGYGGGGAFVVVRYATDGTLDPTFGGDGAVTTNLTSGFDIANALAIDADGKIVVAGEAGFCCELTGGFGLVRYNTDGTLDSTFDGDGKVITDITPDDDTAGDVAIQANGKIVAVGAQAGDGLSARFAVVRYRSDGSLDPRFGADGVVSTRFSAGFDAARAVAIQSDGSIVAAGSTYPDPDGLDGLFALARYEATA